MKAKWTAIFATAISLCLLFLPLTSQAQWSTGIEYNMAFPFTDYGAVFKTGSNLNLEGKYHFNKGWGVGFQTGVTRFINSKDEAFARNNPELTVIPLILNVEYEANGKGMIRPFFAAGLGLSIYTFSYYDAGFHPSQTDATLTMSPPVGVRFFIKGSTICYLKGSYVFVTNARYTYQRLILFASQRIRRTNHRGPNRIETNRPHCD